MLRSGIPFQARPLDILTFLINTLIVGLLVRR